MEVGFHRVFAKAVLWFVGIDALHVIVLAFGISIVLLFSFLYLYLHVKERITNEH